MSEPDTLMGRIATALILDLDTQMQACISTSYESEAWDKFRANIDWKRLALSGVEAVNSNIAYALEVEPKDVTESEAVAVMKTAANNRDPHDHEVGSLTAAFRGLKQKYRITTIEADEPVRQARIDPKIKEAQEALLKFGNTPKTCSTCDGTGQTMTTGCYGMHPSRCPACGGSGQ